MPRYQKLFLIINPASGLDFPVLAYLNRALKKYQVEAEFRITQQPRDAIRFAEEAVERRLEVVGVCGGDGTVMEVSQILCNTGIPLMIFPGGTANVMAKELKIAGDLSVAFDLLGKDDPQLQTVDMATCNHIPFMLRLNTGLLAEMVTDTSRVQKDKLGTLAYALSAMQHLDTLKLRSYSLVLDGKPIELEGVTLMVANAGNIGLPGISLLPNISVSDGLLDVIVLQSADFASLIALASSTVTPMEPPTTLQHWQVKKMTLDIPESQTVLLDDRKLEDRHVEIEVLPQALTIIT